MKATFIGVPGEDHEAITMYGQVFPLGKPVRLESAQAREKLANHPHFKVTSDAAEDAEDAQIKREFAMAAAVAAVGDEQGKANGNGDAAGTGDADSAQAARGRPAGNGKR